MTETLKDACTPAGAEKWHWFNIQNDLVVQGGLKNEDIIIDPLSVREASCGGTYKRMPFFVSWVKDMFLMVSSQKDIPELIKAFSNVVEYNPFCKYTEPSELITYEWDKVNPDGRYKELQAKGQKRNLVRLS